jgi:hypothetical protein
MGTFREVRDRIRALIRSELERLRESRERERRERLLAGGRSSSQSG